ncbi:MAG: permease prefix domain 1-containing protein, partial [Candidatus Acidiferrales bacterium]
MPRWLKKISFWLRSLLHRQELDRDLDDEIAYHLEAKTEENIASGMTPAEAQRAARIDLGGIEQVKEKMRSVRTGAWLDTFLQDIRFGVRMLRKSPGFATVAILTLALGIGANMGAFSVVNTLLLRSLPFREPGRLVLLQNFVPPSDTASQFHDWGRQREYFADAAAFEDIDANLSSGRSVTRAHISQTSWNFFSVLGMQPILGHGFALEDDVDASGLGLPGRNAEAVIGYG